MTFKQFAHLLSAVAATLLGFALWMAPHVDWSRVKDENPFSSRGLVVLGMTIFVYGVNMWAALTPTTTKVRRKP